MNGARGKKVCDFGSIITQDYNRFSNTSLLWQIKTQNNMNVFQLPCFVWQSSTTALIVLNITQWLYLRNCMFNFNRVFSIT